MKALKPTTVDMAAALEALEEWAARESQLSRTSYATHYYERYEAVSRVIVYLRAKRG